MIIYKKLNPFDIAFVYKNDLYIDDFVKQYPKLELIILKHELKHVHSNKFSLKDYFADLSSGVFRNFWTIFKNKPFYILFSSFAMFRRIKNIITIDYSRTLNFILIVIMSLFLYYLKYN